MSSEGGPDAGHGRREWSREGLKLQITKEAKPKNVKHRSHRNGYRKETQGRNAGKPLLDNDLCPTSVTSTRDMRVGRPHVWCLPSWCLWSAGRTLRPHQASPLQVTRHWEVAWPRVPLSTLKPSCTEELWILEGSFTLGRITQTGYSQQKTERPLQLRPFQRVNRPDV